MLSKKGAVWKFMGSHYSLKGQPYEVLCLYQCKCAGCKYKMWFFVLIEELSHCRDVQQWRVCPHHWATLNMHRQNILHRLLAEDHFFRIPRRSMLHARQECVPTGTYLPHNSSLTSDAFHPGSKRQPTSVN